LSEIGIIFAESITVGKASGAERKGTAGGRAHTKLWAIPPEKKRRGQSEEEERLFAIWSSSCCYCRPGESGQTCALNKQHFSTDASLSAPSSRTNATKTVQPVGADEIRHFGQTTLLFISKCARVLKIDGNGVGGKALI
jgi:hypothetical protein